MSATTHVRQHNSMLAAAEKRALVWIASRLPRWINSDHLSALGLAAMAGAGASFWRGAGGSRCGRVTCGAVLAPELVRRQPRRHGRARPRTSSGPATATTSITSSISPARRCCLPGWRRPATCRRSIATLVVAAFFLVSAETYLATHARGVFKMAFLGVGPTELRILLAAGAIALDQHADGRRPFGLGPVRLWDLGGVIGAIGMPATFLISVDAEHPRALHRGDPPPSRPEAATARSRRRSLERHERRRIDERFVRFAVAGLADSSSRSRRWRC